MIAACCGFVARRRPSSTSAPAHTSSTAHCRRARSGTSSARRDAWTGRCRGWCRSPARRRTGTRYRFRSRAVSRCWRPPPATAAKVGPAARNLMPFRSAGFSMQPSFDAMPPANHVIDSTMTPLSAMILRHVGHELGLVDPPGARGAADKAGRECRAEGRHLAAGIVQREKGNIELPVDQGIPPDRWA